MGLLVAERLMDTETSSKQSRGYVGLSSIGLVASVGSFYTLTTNFRYRRLGDLNREPAMLCACADGEQQTIIKIVIHFL